MISRYQIVFLVLCSLVISQSALAQKDGHISAPAEKSGTVTVKGAKGAQEKWIRTGIKKYKFSVAYPEDWTVEQLEHPDPDELVPDSTVDLNVNDFNAIEMNREGFETGMPYVLVYAVKKPVQGFNDYFTKLQNDLGFTGANFLGADSAKTFKGYPMYDVTYEVKQYMANVRTIVIYANGYRYGLMYTALEDQKGNAFRKHMPRFERLLETLELSKD